jgi:hydrogenase nickel incorporation protein HypA/HybF
MHEASIARRLLDVVLAAAGSARVYAIRGWVAETEALSRDSLAFQFAAHARGTAAEDARLDLRIVRVDARCRACGDTYAPDHHVLLCPACGATDGELLGETGVGVDAVEVGDS